MCLFPGTPLAPGCCFPGPIQSADTQTRTKGSEKRPLELEAPHNQMLPGQHSEESQVSLLYKVKDKQRKQEALTRNKSPRPKRSKLCLQKAVKQGFPRCVLGVVHHWGQDKEERHLGQRADWRVRQGMEGLRLPQQPTSLAHCIARPRWGPRKPGTRLSWGKTNPPTPASKLESECASRMALSNAGISPIQV